MGIDYSTLIYLPNFDFWSRAVTFTPLASQPNAGAYNARGIFDTEPLAAGKSVSARRRL